MTFPAALLIGRTWQKHIAELNGGKIEHNLNPESVFFKHPGLNLNHFDREGNPSISPVMKFLIELRNCGFYIPYVGKDQCFLDWPRLKGSSLNFLSATFLTFSRALYAMDIAKWPLDVRLSLDSVGNSSISILLTIHTSGSQEALATHGMNIVLVDSVTRRPKNLPDWFTAKYRGRGVSNNPWRVNTLVKPRETYRHQLQVMWSDTDANNHTNYSSYVQFAVNGLRRALQLRLKSQSQEQQSEEEGASIRQALHCLRGISTEILRNGLKSVKLCYLKECGEGDIIDLHLWQESGQELTVFCIAESQGQTLCHLQLEYFNTVSHL